MRPIGRLASGSSDPHPCFEPAFCQQEQPSLLSSLASSSPCRFPGDKPTAVRQSRASGTFSLPQAPLPPDGQLGRALGLRRQRRLQRPPGAAHAVLAAAGVAGAPPRAAAAEPVSLRGGL
ncbi:MAG: hypothetical protein Q8P67_20165 [archaeon]|nr:hypothetical protein [archaeon]